MIFLNFFLTLTFTLLTELTFLTLQLLSHKASEIYKGCE